MAVQVGQRWRSVGDGHLIEIVARAHNGWHVRFDESHVLTIVEEDDLRDKYEHAEPRDTVRA